MKQVNKKSNLSFQVRQRCSSLIKSMYLLFIFLGGCSDSGGFSTPPVEIDYRIHLLYVGEITVINKSQFTYNELYLHQFVNEELLSETNLIPDRLEPNETIQIEVDGAQYITAIRPRVDGGPLWKVKSAREVSFYTNRTPDSDSTEDNLIEAPIIPTLWILDQGFMVLDALTK